LESLRSPIVGLLLVSRPAAVLRGVVALVIDTVKGVFPVRLGSHVAHEPLKGVPSGRDQHPLVSRILGVIGVPASLAHIDPGTVLGRVLSSKSNIWHTGSIPRGAL